MQLDLSGKHALVGGASKGIGLAAARELAELGAAVTLLARDSELLARACAELPTPRGQQHSFASIDFGRPQLLSDTLNPIVQSRPVQILVNNAGGPAAGAIIDASLEQFEAAFASHLLANQCLVQTVLPGMRQAGYGRIINIISTSVREPIPGLGVSNTTRGAVASWAKTLATELGPDQITVNNVLPGFTQTERLGQLIDSWAEQRELTTEQMIAALEQQVPMARFADPSEIASLIGFLASPAAAYISGQSIAADGGRTRAI